MDEEARYPLPNDTPHLRMRGRQYHLITDLGEGVDRRNLLIGGAIVPMWAGIMWLFSVNALDAPWAYIVPPVFLIWLVVREDHGGRPMYAAWWDRIRYWRRRKEPLVPRPGEATTNAIDDQPIMVRAEMLVIDLNTVKGKTP